MRKIKLANGEEFEVDLCAVADDYLRIELKTNVRLSDLAVTFDNIGNTSVIECYYEETDIGHKVYEGYTYLYAIGYETNHVVVMLRHLDS